MKEIKPTFFRLPGDMISLGRLRSLNKCLEFRILPCNGSFRVSRLAARMLKKHW